MTQSNKSTDREIYGIIGKFPNASKIQKEWNEYFKEKGIDAFMAKYPTEIDELPERLSEMFHFDRRMYLVGEDLQTSINQLIDILDESSDENGKANVIINNQGVLKGYWKEEISPKYLTEIVNH